MKGKIQMSYSEACPKKKSWKMIPWCLYSPSAQHCRHFVCSAKRFILCIIISFIHHFRHIFWGWADGINDFPLKDSEKVSWAPFASFCLKNKSKQQQENTNMSNFPDRRKPNQVVNKFENYVAPLPQMHHQWQVESNQECNLVPMFLFENGKRKLLKSAELRPAKTKPFIQ